jgi:hypothetical protein
MIITNGDSFTYGDELDKPYSEAWPYILAEKLDLDVINLGENGSSNSRILQTTKDYYAQLPRPAPSPSFIKHFAGRPDKNESMQTYYTPKVWIIQWTTFRRFIDGENGNDIPMDVVLQKLDKQYLLDLYFIQVRDMQEWFEWHGFTYLMFNGFDNEKYIRDNDSEFKSLVDDKYFIGWPDESVVNWVYEYEHGPRGHPRQEGHKRIAEILYENIRHKLRIS